MTPPHFQIGDEVQIIGPTRSGGGFGLGRKITISEIVTTKCDKYYSDDCMPWYPASSLRLVEDLQVGDWVKVVGPIGKEYCHYNDPQTFQISEICDGKERTYRVRDSSLPGYPATSLRKLAPPEVAGHLANCEKYNDIPVNVPTRTEKLMDRLQNSERRLSAIESRLDAQKDAIIEIDRVLKVRKVFMDDFNGRLAVLEGKRPEVTYRLRPEIPSGACFSVEKKSNGSITVTYSDLGVELAKMVLDSMKEA